MMVQIKKLCLFYLPLLLGLAGCTALSSTTLVSVNSEQASAEMPQAMPVASACPVPTKETLSFQHEAAGYCLLYPNGYLVQQLYEEGTLLLPDANPAAAQASVVIEVGDAVNHSVAQIADEVITMVYASWPDWEFERTEGFTVGGEAAIMLDPLPGRELTRQVLFVHDNRLFRLIFFPSDPEQADALAKMEALYSTVINSFTFADAVAEAADAVADEFVTDTLR
jgi:hypothetical protein